MTAKRRLVNTAVNCLSAARLPSLLRRFQKDECCILMLHGVTRHRSHEGIGNVEDLNIHVDDLDLICGLLGESYNVVPLERIISCMEAGEPFPDRAVVLTFDDGYESNYRLALPVLKRHGLHATIFLATEFVNKGTRMWWDRLEYALGHTTQSSFSLNIGSLAFHLPLGDDAERVSAYFQILQAIKNLPQEGVSDQISKVEEALECSLLAAKDVPGIYRSMTWEQARTMQESGHFSFGAHTHRHRILGRCQIETAREELYTCREMLREKLGIESPHFSYPNGHRGDHSPQTRGLLQELGFRSGLLTETGFNRFEDDRWTLKRFSTGNNARYVDVTASGALNVLLSINDAIRGRKAA